MEAQDQVTKGCEGEEPGDDCPQPLVGEVLGDRYRIESRIGYGGMGVVFRAVHEDLGCACAIKLVRRELASRTRTLERFQREARLLGGMRHDNITQVYDVGQYRGRAPYIVMELLEGRSLRAELDAGGPLELSRALRLFRQTCLAVAYAHERGVIHRDLKPENLMLTRSSEGDERVKLLDFGIAQSLEPVDSRLTPTGATLGTSHYMSPEQARGETALSAASDVYSLGVILYELLSGTRPHVGDSYAAVIFQLLTQPPKPLRHHVPDCPRAILDIVEVCLSARPEQRYESAVELLRALEPALPPAASRVTSAPATDVPGRLARRAGSPRRRRLGRGALAAAVFLPTLAAVAMLGFGVEFTRDSRASSRALVALSAGPSTPFRVLAAQGPSRSVERVEPDVRRPAIAAVDVPQATQSAVDPVLDRTLKSRPGSGTAAKRNPAAEVPSAARPSAAPEVVRQELPQEGTARALPFVSRNPYE